MPSFVLSLHLHEAVHKKLTFTIIKSQKGVFLRLLRSVLDTSGNSPKQAIDVAKVRPSSF